MQWNEFLFHIRHIATSDQKLIQKAFELGAQAHGHQKRQSGEPYFTHPIAVAQILANMGGDRDTIIAALLHDTVEDTPLTLDEIKDQFGPVVAMLIDGVTKLNEEDIAEHPSLNEQIETLRKMFNLMERDVRIMVIKLADRLHNMQTIGFRKVEKQISVARETMDVYVKIADRLCMRDMRDDLENMCLVILEPERHAQIVNLRKKNEEEAAAILPPIQKEIERAVTDLPFTMFPEHKSWTSLARQLETALQGKSIRHSITAAFVCDSEDDCYRMLGALHKIWQRETLTFEDFINAPIINGYKGLHTTIILQSGIRVRCKIRTKEMQEYAHRGITTACFDSTVIGATDYLAWTSRISPVSKDTTDKSSEFWESLQNDILGESIVVHGASDETELLPKGSTALDGIFYLYGERGTHVTQIFVNGSEVKFYEALPYAAIVEGTFIDDEQVDLKWLQYTNTGIGTAFIRNALTRREGGTKRTNGQLLLQEYLTTRRRGFINELNSNFIKEVLSKNNYKNLDELYEQISEGRITLSEVENLFFIQTKERSKDAPNSYTLRYEIAPEHQKTVQDIVLQYPVTTFRIMHTSDTHVISKISLQLTDEEMQNLAFTLDHVIEGRFRLRRNNALYKASVFSVCLFLLWGLDPVAAHQLLTLPGVSPVDLTMVRFVTHAVLSGLFLGWIRYNHPLPEARLSLKNASLWLSVFFLFMVAITTYLSLQNTLPSHYTIPMTAAGLLLTTLVNRKQIYTLILTWILVFTGMGILLMNTPTWDTRSVIFTLLAVSSFTGFSIVSERYKRKEQVSLRASQYFFIMAAVCALMCIPLYPFSSFSDVSAQGMSLMILFSIFVSGFPYYIYYYLLSHKEIDFVLRYSFLIIPITLLCQALLIGKPESFTVLSALLVMIGASLPLLNAYRKKYLINTAGLELMKAAARPSQANP